jgi:hypothetical protein
MKLRMTLPTLMALALLSSIPASTQSRAMNLVSTAPSIDTSAKVQDGLIVLAATARHSSAAAIKTCNKIHNRSQRERCLGNMR